MGGRLEVDSRLRSAAEAGAQAPSAAITVGDGGATQTWLVPFLSVLVVGALTSADCCALRFRAVACCLCWRFARVFCGI